MDQASAPLVLHVFPTFAVGGAQMRFATLANRLGHEWRHAIVALDGVTEGRSLLSPGLDVTFVATATRKGETFGNLRRIRHMLRSLCPAIMVTSNWGSIEWALANLSPLTRHIHTEDGFGPEERSVQLRRRVWVRRLALRRSTVVVPSDTLLRIARDVWRLAPAHLRYIPNGVDLTRYAAPARRSGTAEERLVVGIVAALRPEKNVGRLLRAFKRSGVSARLVVVGDGGERPGLEALAAGLGLAEQVQFVGHIAQPERLYVTFDLFALSSDTEQMPLSVLEAMAAGLPVVATDVGDIRLMVAAENRPFIVPAEEATLSAALQTLLSDRALRHRVGEANRLKTEREYDQDAMVQAYASLWNGAA